MSQPPSSRPLPAAGTPLTEVGEFGVLDLLAAVLPQDERVLIGPGDDAAEVRAGGGRVLVATDVLVEGRHFRRDWATAGDIGRRAAAQSLSDLNAMGGRATAVTVGIATPGEVDARWVVELSEGIAAECAEVGASVVGGDLTAADAVVLAVTAVGEVDGEPVRRGGARPGDIVAVAGRLGWAAAGLAVLARGFRSPRAVVEGYRRPQVPYAAGPEALVLGATSLVDVSDGLLADLGHVAAASGVRVDLDPQAFTVDEPLQAVGAALGVDPLRFVLTGGDDHALVATFPPTTALPAGWRVVGRVLEGRSKPEAAPGATLVTVAQEEYDGDAGFRHF